MQKARGQLYPATSRGTRASHCLYACGFRYYFTPLAGVLFTFPSRYWFTIGRKLVFSLTGWSPWIPAGFHVPRGTQVPASSPSSFAYAAITLYGSPFQRASTRKRIGNSTGAGPTTPASPEGETGLGYSDFARHYFRNLG